MENIKKDNSMLFRLFLITMFINLAFPKAGIKLAGIPLTVGNMFFVLTFAFWLVEIVKKNRLRSSRTHAILVIFILYCVLKFTIAFKCGVSSVAALAIYFVPCAIYPLSLFLVYDLVINEYRKNKVIKIIEISFYIITIYSIIQLFFGVGNVDIPGITVNYSDYKDMGQEWYMKKSNGTTEETLKMVSTYQNGNLYGIGLLIMYPMLFNYYCMEKNTKKKIISLVLFMVSIFICLSRAAWFGLAIFMLMVILNGKNKNYKALIGKIVLLIVACALVSIVTSKIPSVYNRLRESNSIEKVSSMAGRTEGMIVFLDNYNNLTNPLAILFGPMGIENIDGLAYEMTPISIINVLGALGLIIWLLLFVIIYRSIDRKNKSTKIYAQTLVIWFITGLIEGGYWLPPTVINLFAILGFGLALSNIKENEEF